MVSALALVLAVGDAAMRPAFRARSAPAVDAPIFADDFESGTLAAWEMSQGLQPVQGSAYSGVWSAQASAKGEAAFAGVTLGAPVAQGVMSAAFRVSDLTTRATLMKLRAADGSTITVGLNLRGGLFAFMAADEVVLDSDEIVTPDIWHLLSVEFVTGARATARVSLDGVVVKEIAATSVVDPIDRVGIGTRRVDRTFDLGFDAVSLHPLDDSNPTPPPEPEPGSALVAAAGDIACDPADNSFNGGAGTANACRMADTADLLTDADVVLPLGDIQYEDGALDLYSQSYDPTWGRFLDVSRPAVGNHEYEQPGASAYFTYFGAAAGTRGEGWYSYDVGSWHVVALNSECSIVGCGPGSEQHAWLQRDLAANEASCTMAYWHRPLFSSGHHGSYQATASFWRLLQADGAEIVLAGHDHHYERFAPQDASGVSDPAGIRSFVVGSGGKNMNALEGDPAANSQARNDQVFGVLNLSLEENGYDWRFEPIAGSSYADAGSADCS